MPYSPNTELLDEIVSRLNHQMTGALARLEGLYLLYKEEGQLRDDLWEKTFQQAKQEAFAELNRSFTLSKSEYVTSLKVA